MLIIKVDHPGWAVKYPNNPEGEWVQYGAHGSGCWYTKYVAYAPTHETKEEAEKEAQWLAKDEGMTATYEIVVAWEPLVAELQQKVAELKKCNSISQDDLWEVAESISNIQQLLKLKG